MTQLRLSTGARLPNRRYIKIEDDSLTLDVYLAYCKRNSQRIRLFKNWFDYYLKLGEI